MRSSLPASWAIALQVGAEALSGLVGGFVAAFFVELPLILLVLLAMAAALLLKVEVSQDGDDRSGAS